MHASGLATGIFERRSLANSSKPCADFMCRTSSSVASGFEMWQDGDINRGLSRKMASKLQATVSQVPVYARCEVARRCLRIRRVSSRRFLSHAACKLRAGVSVLPAVYSL